METDKLAVREFWERASCGEVYASGATQKAQFDAQARVRYQLEPFIFSFADFPSAKGKHVLEIGVGMGADHLQWAAHQPAFLAGVDLSDRAVEFSRARLRAAGLNDALAVADAEQLPFDNALFDIVYSWGVLHHSPDTPRAISEVYRVLRPGGRASIMIYHRDSIVGCLLWLRYGVAQGLSLADVYSRYLESPGTKAYSLEAARSLFHAFTRVDTNITLSAGDLMLGAVGQRHRGLLLSVARGIWPRFLIRRVARARGLFLMITAIK